MNFWKQIPNATRIYLVILVYLIILLCGLVLFRQWRENPEFFAIRLSLKGSDEMGQLTKTAEALLIQAGTATLPPDAAWLRAKTNLRVFGGPGNEYPGIAWLEDNQIAEIIGRDAGSEWWSIRLPYIETGSGWVASSQVEANNTSNVTVVDSLAETVQPSSTPQDYPRARAIANVNIRSGPDLKYQKIGTLKIEETAEILAASVDDYWWLIKVPGTEDLKGWISRDYVIAQNTDKVPVISDMSDLEETIEAGSAFLRATATVNVRSGPNTEFAVIGQLNEGQVAEIVGKTADGIWWAIRFPGAENEQAWVAAAYVAAQNTAKVPVIK